MTETNTNPAPTKGWRPGCATAVLSIWAGFMVATAGIAVLPQLTRLVTPIVCPDGAAVDSSSFSYGPGSSGVSRHYNCLDANGRPEPAMVKTIGATFLAYTLIFYLLLCLHGLWRARRTPPTAPTPTPPKAPGQPHANRPPERSPTAPPAAPDLTARLTELKRLHDQGLIDDQDYETKKAEILSGP